MKVYDQAGKEDHILYVNDCLLFAIDRLLFVRDPDSGSYNLDQDRILSLRTFEIHDRLVQFFRSCTSPLNLDGLKLSRSGSAI